MPASPPSRAIPQRLLPLRGGRPVLIAAGLVLTLCAGLLLIFSPLFIQETELRLYDLMLAGRAAPQKSGVPVIVGIDEESLNAYGQWPWPRYRMARLVERLEALGAQVVVLDFLMPEPDRTSPDIIMAERQRDLGQLPSPPPAAVTDVNSQRLATALAGGPTVLGYYLDLAAGAKSGAGGAPRLPAGMVVAAMPGAGAQWPAPTGMIRGIGTLTAAVGAEGFTNAQHDMDGVLRRVPLLMRYEGAYYPSLALGAVLLASKNRHLSIDRDASETLLRWGDRRIPLDRLGNALIDFRSRDSFPYFSARAILDGHPAAGSLRGKIVLIGAWAKGLGDVHQVPSGQELHGVEAHAAVIDTILAGTFIAQPSWARGAGLFAVLLLGGVSTWLLSRPGYVLSLLAVMGMSGGCFWGARALLLSREGVFIPPLVPMATPILVMTVLSLMKYGIEARKVQQRNRDLMQAQDTIIVSMSTLTAARDKESGQHILRTQRYVEVLARQLATLPGYALLDEANIELLAKSAPLHDIGKVGIPDHILCKPGVLTAEEYDIMKTHTLIGAQALSKTMGGTEHPEKLAFLNYALQMAESHHEKWDGSGYPLGLSGRAIPLAGRLMALADVYDALVSRRVYKRDFSHEEAKEWIMARSGTHFDPEVVGAFVAQSEEFIRIARELADEA